MSSLVHTSRDDFERLMDRLVAERRARISVACALADGTVIDYAAGHADLNQRRPARTDTRYLWFSVTKPFTATAVLQLAAAGAIDLDQPVSTSLPDLRLRGAVTPTVRHFLSHMAGLPNPVPLTWIHLVSENAPPLAAMTARLLRKRPRFAPGLRVLYSNIGYLVLGLLIERVAGMAFERYIARHILEPLGMAASGFAHTPDVATGYFRAWSMMGLVGRTLVAERFFGPTRRGLTPLLPFLIDGAPYGGLVGTARDALQLGRAMLAGGVLDGKTILPRSSVDAALAPAVLADGSRTEAGLGWWLGDAGGEPFAYHGGIGGGYSAELRIYPRLNYAIAIAANLSQFDTTALSRVIVSPAP